MTTRSGAQAFADVAANVAAGTPPRPDLPDLPKSGLYFVPGGVDALGKPLPDVRDTLPVGFELAAFRRRTLRGQRDYLFTLPVPQRRAILALLSPQHKTALLTLSINPQTAHNQAIAFAQGRTYRAPPGSGSYPDGTFYLYRAGRPMSPTSSAVLDFFRGTPSTAQTERTVQGARFADTLRDTWDDVTGWWDEQARRLPDALRNVVQEAADRLGLPLGAALMALVAAGLVVLMLK